MLCCAELLPWAVDQGSTQVLLAQGLDAIEDSGSFLTGAEVLPAPLANHHEAQQFEQSGDDRNQIDRVKNTLDQHLDNNDRDDHTGGFADPAHLIPVDRIEGLIDIAQNFAVAFAEMATGFAGSVVAAVGRGVMGHGVLHLTCLALFNSVVVGVAHGPGGRLC